MSPARQTSSGGQISIYTRRAEGPNRAAFERGVRGELPGSAGQEQVRGSLPGIGAANSRTRPAPTKTRICQRRTSLVCVPIAFVESGSRLERVEIPDGF